MENPPSCKGHRKTRHEGRCYINRARSIDVYAQRSRGQPPIKDRFQSNCLIFSKKCARRCCINRT
ncbi:MAG: hypothetical protein V3Q69_01255 [Burkholderia sp.]